MKSHVFPIFFFLFLIQIQGCIRLLPENKTPMQMLSFGRMQVSGVAKGKRIYKKSPRLLISRPHALSLYAKNELVLVHDGNYTFVQNYQWIDNLTDLVKMHTLETLQNAAFESTQIVLETETQIRPQDIVLTLDIRKFHIEASKDKHQVEISFYLTLNKYSSSLELEQIKAKEFNYSIPSDHSMNQYSQAFHQGMNQFSQDIITFVQ